MTSEVAPVMHANWDMGIESKGLRTLGNIKIPKRFLNRLSFGVPVIDQLINGDGLVRGQRLTVSSSRGCGKTTFLLSALQHLTTYNRGLRTAYISNEECIEQLAFTANRIGSINVVGDNMSDIDEIAKLMVNLDVIVIDSIAGLTCSHIHAPHLRDIYALTTLSKAAQDNECAIFFIQHHTKAGIAKGNSGIQHAVDLCLSINKPDPEVYGDSAREFEVDKNRFGSCCNVILSLTKEGFDFENPITHSIIESNPAGKYVAAKQRDNAEIMKVIRDKTNDGGAALQNFAKLDIDMGRVERLLKELVNRGVATLIGGGRGPGRPAKHWFLGDTKPEDFDEEDD